MGIAFAILGDYGTIFPLLAEGLANRKISVQAPFFNQVSLPLIIVLLILMGITPFLAWNKASITRMRANLWLPVAKVPWALKLSYSLKEQICFLNRKAFTK